MLTQAGFRVSFASYWNTFLFPLMVLKRKILGGDESDVRPFPPPFEFLFRAVLSFERGLLRVGLRLRREHHSSGVRASNMPMSSKATED